VEELYQQEQEFMFGIADDNKPGAADCIRQIMSEGIFMKSHRQIAECRPVQKELGDIMSDVLDNYCMPEIATY